MVPVSKKNTAAIKHPLGSHAADLAELRVVQDLLEKAEAKIVRDNLAICGYFSMISYYIALWAPTFIFTFFFGWRGFFCGVVCVMSSKSLEQCRKVMEKCSDY